MRDTHDSETTRVSRLSVTKFGVGNLDVGKEKVDGCGLRLPRGNPCLRWRHCSKWETVEDCGWTILPRSRSVPRPEGTEHARLAPNDFKEGIHVYFPTCTYILLDLAL